MIAKFRPQEFLALIGLIVLDGLAMYYQFEDLAKIIGGGIIAIATSIVTKGRSDTE